jgi:hypothetical protein
MTSDFDYPRNSSQYLSTRSEGDRVKAEPDLIRMRRKDQATAPVVEPVAGDKAPRKNAITEARREQNRRAQRVFREFTLVDQLALALTFS